MGGQMQQSNAAAATALYDHPAAGAAAGPLHNAGPTNDAGDAVMARWLQSAGLQHLASPLASTAASAVDNRLLPNLLMQGYGAQSAEEKQRLFKLMRNLNFNGESGSEPYTPTAQTSGGPASEGVYSPEFRGDFGAGLLDLHAMDDTELLSEEETDSWLENAANGLMGSQIVKGKEQIKFVVDVFLGLKFSISGTLFKSGSNSYDVTMDDAAIIGGGFGY